MPLNYTHLSNALASQHQVIVIKILPTIASTPTSAETSCQQHHHESEGTFKHMSTTPKLKNSPKQCTINCS